jgi:Na+-driven multidrug efflux pump
MTTTLSAAAINAILDPLLIFTAGLGLEGAAIATVIARITLFVVAWKPIVNRYDAVARPSLAGLRADTAPVLGIAGPAILTNIATPIGFAFVTRMIASFGTQAVAGYAVIGRLTPFAFCLVFGLSGAVGPIIGQNFGAGCYDRVREALRTAFGFVALYVLAVSLILYIFRHNIADLFNTTGEARDLVLLFCGPLALAFFFNAALFTTNAAFNNLDRPFFSTLLNWGRHTLGTVPFAWVGARMMGAEGVLIGQYAGGAFFAILSVWMAFRLIEGHARGAPPRTVTTFLIQSRAAQWPFSNWRP